MPFWKRTPQPSEVEQLCNTIRDLAKEVIAQSAANGQLTQKLLAALSEKDAQIRSVLDSQFQQRVTVFPPRPQPPSYPGNIQDLNDVSEMSEESAKELIDQVNANYKNATDRMEEEFKKEFLSIATEHEEDHR